MQDGGCHPADGCQDGDGFAGARLPVPRGRRDRSGRCRPTATGRRSCGPRFRHLVRQRARRRQRAPAPAVLDQDGRRREDRVHRHDARGHPALVTPAGVAGLEFRDEAETANSTCRSSSGRASRRSSCSSTRAACHDRRRSTTAPASRGADRRHRRARSTPRSTSSSAATRTRRTSATIDGKLVTSAGSFGRLITDIDLTIDSTTGEVTAMTATNGSSPATSAGTRRRRR